MALKIPVPFPIFPPPVQSPNNPNQTRHRPPSELRFSRWNNANAEKFNERRRTLKEIEDDLRMDRRFGSANRIAKYYDSATVSPAETFKSAGTPSHPSRPSIPGKKSKYSKNPNPNPSPESQHPAFRRFHQSGENVETGVIRNPRPRPPISRDANVKISEDGVSYVIDGAPFEFKYSYTETPKVKPVGLREEAYAPFGPTTMARPWTGRAPLPASKKAPREFDSFKLPPPHKKGVKPVQSPGPYLAGSGPKYVRTREEILGEPLTKQERSEMIQSCKKTQRQLNMGTNVFIIKA